MALTWLESEATDLQCYRIYRDTSPDFVIVPERLVHSTAECEWLDSAPLDGPVFYKLTAQDHAGNQSAPASLANIVGVAEGEALPVAFALHASAPNPFGRATAMAFDVAQSGKVRIEVFDVQGRHVRSLVAGALPRGRYRAEWDGKDAHGRRVAAGMYLCRMEAGSFREVRRLVLIR